MTKKERIKLESMDLRQLREVEDQLCTAMRECSETLCSVRGEIMMRIRENYEAKQEGREPDALDKALEDLLPGDGWRFLQNGEMKRAGDEWKYAVGVSEWRPVICPGETYYDTGITIVRRRVP